MSLSQTEIHKRWAQKNKVLLAEYRRLWNKKHLIKSRRIALRHYYKHRDEILARQRVYSRQAAQHRKIYAHSYWLKHKRKIRKYAREWRTKNRDYMEAYNIVRNVKIKLERNILRRKALFYYSHGTMRCQCCGVGGNIYLALDHRNNDGNKERKQRLEGLRYYRYIIQNNYPPKYTVLCHNCNWAKAHGGYHHSIFNLNLPTFPILQRCFM